jgi:hypothetical protein
LGRWEDGKIGTSSPPNFFLLFFLSSALPNFFLLLFRSSYLLLLVYFVVKNSMNRRSSKTIFLFTLFILLSTIPVFGQTAHAQYFTVGFQQDGQLIPIKNHQVFLKKKTFTLVVSFKQPDSVLINASFEPQSFEQARTGSSLENIQGFSDLGMAEEAFNPKSLLMLSSKAPHYWYYQDETNHRFNDIAQQNGMWICRRIIGQVMYRDTTREMRRISDIPENELYLVFMKTVWAQDFSQQFEKQREYVKIIFR